jgi:hypothetical protein
MDGKPLPDDLGGKMLKGGIDEIRADHTYSTVNSAVGRTHGTWKIDGNTVVLTPDTRIRQMARVATLVIDKPYLINRGDITQTYEKNGPAPTDRTPRFKLTMAGFLDEVKKDRNAAQKKYNDVPIEITGVVMSIQQRASGPYVMLAGAGAPGTKDSDLPLSGFLCSTLQPEFWSTIGRLQHVKAVGIPVIFQSSMELAETVFTPDGPSILQHVTAEQLSADCAKDGDAFKKKYTTDQGAACMIITGVVLEKTIKKGTWSVLMLGPQNAPVTCLYCNDGMDVAKDLESVSQGQTVKLAGELNTYGDSKGPELVNCMLVRN